MSWTLERMFYGNKNGLDLKSMWDFLMRGYYFIPRTLFKDYYRAVVYTGDTNEVYRRVEKPFPDAIKAQRPSDKFALHLSGGFDSSILAKLYDRDDADYIHLTGPESGKARALAATLTGTLREIQIAPEDFIQAAEEMIHRLPEPYPFEDVVYAYIASKKAKELGHSLIVAGDGGDGIFGGACVGPYSRKAIVAWKTIDPTRLLGLQVHQPFMHTALYAWSKAMLDPKLTGWSKRFAQDYCRQLGMPDEVTGQKKTYWAGSLGTRTSPKVVAHMQAVVDDSDYKWIRQFEFTQKPTADLLFRQYGLVKWLQANYKERLNAYEIRELSQGVQQVSATERRQVQTARRKELICRYCPRGAINMARRMRDRIVRC